MAILQEVPSFVEIKKLPWLVLAISVFPSAEMVTL